MKVKETFFVKYGDGKSAWLAPDATMPDGVTSQELRPMLYPADGMVLRHKQTGETFECVWLKDTTADDYEEITQDKKEDDPWQTTQK